MIIRRINTIEEFERCLEIQRKAWGFETDLDVVPVPIFVLSREFGGLVLGAFEGEEMIGFSLAFPLKEDSELVLHSHMTAVLPEYQGKGVGYRLKLKQREEAAKLGYSKITWTYDPLQSRNAYFNLHKLGAEAVKFYRNFYGVLNSETNRGFPTHRFLVEWTVEERKKEIPPVEVMISLENPPEELPEADVIGIEIPADIEEEKRRLGKEAIKFYNAEERVFSHYISNYKAIDFIKGEKCYYVLVRKSN